MVKWFKPLEDEFESVIEWLLYFDRHWYINSGAITDISVHEPDIHVLSKVCRVSLTSVGILSTLCSVPSLSSSCQTDKPMMNSMGSCIIMKFKQTWYSSRVINIRKWLLLF